jgi:hypothetical protein
MKNFDDFGFTFDEPTSAPVEQKVDESLLRLIEEHKELVTKEVMGKLKEVENLILPLLLNLQKNSEKEYLHWPNRTEIIQKQIEKITNITRS